MKKIICIVLPILLFCNFVNAEKPDLGLASFGFSCDPISGKAKDKKYIGFVNEKLSNDEEFLFKLGIDDQDNSFYFIEDSPLYFKNIVNNDHSLKDVYIWYDFFIYEGKVFPIWFDNVFYYDEKKTKTFL